jgi:hypothetical protein
VQPMQRPFQRRYARWHPHVHVTSGGTIHRRGAPALSMAAGPAGIVRQPGTDLPYQGMDPSDPNTWVRPYRPRPGMISFLNLDGAVPNPTGGVQRGRQPHLFWRGGVAGSSVRNG